MLGLKGTLVLDVKIRHASDYIFWTLYKGSLHSLKKLTLKYMQNCRMVYTD